MNDDTDPVLPPHGKPPASKPGEALLACNRCETLTPHSTLAHLGGRCFRCYAAYCRERPPAKSHGETPAQAEIRAGVRARQQRGEGEAA